MFSSEETLAQARARNIHEALAEDIGHCDWTALLVPVGRRVAAQVRVREAAVLCGRDWFDGVFAALDATARIAWLYDEGASMTADGIVCRIEADGRALLSAERPALNFLQLLSGTATITRAHVDAVAGASPNAKGCAILDTRKTVPGLRLAQKYAVRVGGGQNQRLALYAGILIKENHIAAAEAWARRCGRPRRCSRAWTSRSRSRPSRSCARRWRPAPSACCSITSASRRCARPWPSTPVGRCWRCRAA